MQWKNNRQLTVTPAQHYNMSDGNSDQNWSTCMRACPKEFSTLCHAWKTAEEMGKSLDKHSSNCPCNWTCAAVLHNKTVEPDGEIQPWIRSLYSRKYIDKAYNLKVQVDLLFCLNFPLRMHKNLLLTPIHPQKIMHDVLWLTVLTQPQIKSQIKNN